MKYRILLFGLLFSISSFAQVDLTNGLVGYYPLNGDYDDYSGNNNHGTANLVTQVKDRHSIPKNATNFNGTSSYIDIPNHSSLQASSGLSVSIWFKIDNETNRVTDFIRRGFDDDTKGTFDLRYIHDANDLSYAIKFNNGVRLGANYTVSLNHNQWYHLVGTYDGTKMRLYLDGALVATTDAAHGIPICNDKIRMGMTYNSTWPYQLAGDLDEISIYNRGLNPQEVTALHTGIDPTTYPGKLVGKIYTDDNSNCKYDAGEQTQEGVIMVATPGNFYGVTDANGNYEIFVPFGNYIVKPLVNYTIKELTTFPCETNGELSGESNLAKPTASGLNIAVEIEKCAIMTVDIQSDRRRRCFDNNTFVKYCNNGYADAEDVKVFVQMPDHLSVKSASEPFTAQGNGLLVFNIGTVKAGECKTIKIIDHVECGNESIRGKTVCTKAWITPKNSCTDPDAGWDKSDIVVKPECIGDSLVRFVLYNMGDGDMKDSLEFRLFADDTLAFKHKYKIANGDSLVIQLNPNGYTIRLEADQHAKHPFQKWVAAFIEACNLNLDIAMKGAPLRFPNDDEANEVSIHCLEIRDSYDPNDKKVTPEGVTAQKIVNPNIPLHYRVRFQNTGNDTAYKVVVVDTLPAGLDIATLQMGASSHKYTYTITGKERPILTFTFDNIYLPDSFTDEPGSNGFLKYTIFPKEDLALGTKIQGFADIFFDFNSPVRTNTTLTTIDIISNEDFTLLDSVRVGNKNVWVYKLPHANIAIKLYPNPASDRLNFELIGLSTGEEISYVLTNTVGKKCAFNTFYANGDHVLETINLNDLQKGVYFLTVIINGERIVQKVLVQ